MFKKTHLFTSLFIAMLIMLFSIHEAEAKRFGGGSSFGSKPSYSQPFQHSTSPNSVNQPMHTPSPSQQQAATQNQAARQNFANRSGLMGMLGGLAIGGLLGSLFFGGAFEHINFMDFFIFAGIAYLLYRLFAAKSAKQNQAVGNTMSRTPYNDNIQPAGYQNNSQTASNSTGFNTDVLFNKNKKNPASIPANFDQPDFLAGAERAYRYLQAAWDNNDLSSIRGLTTDKVFAEIQDQLRASDSTNKTEIIKLKADLLEVRENGAVMEAAVLFESLMRENDSSEEIVKELWHFIKPVNSAQPKWFLDGIQQITD
jgi:predicted lipid-binding transport protein (Tim44 family)